MCGLPTTQQSDDQEQVFFVEAMSSYIILMMPKNQELSKFQRIRSKKGSRIKFQRIKIQKQSSFKNQDSRTIKMKIQESREDSIKISTKIFFQNIE